ncbi:MerR family transcriptional regulator [Flavobacterium subsaxonicum]|uniref:MerR family transcriptional regulator n=1 Tax=Flavobacterium subsaxonicum WB 4.1-42 = DSM 21790 TaxID=1121898 RepID=A0A0A2MKA6_9FLAO|nr:MerR family transcriptional regulator [Flavobacterium subsaxonicum]KGO93072.1 MerR family transcriptional regulator [Flavobacterium subsaxonicum WB 4.1-42 = DSM 21790]
MNSPKNVFTIKDLENLSGIKAHTIRIWEKRYSVLQPMRTDTNIRVYDVHNLQKLLNICTLHSFGYKISAIAKLPEDKIPAMVRGILSNKTLDSHVLNNFKLAMMNFDQQLFLSTYNSLLSEKSFRDIFYGCFIPLLEEIGELWQTDTITPAHEHFISSLVKQKIASNTEKLQLQPPVKTDRVFVLYLPEGEIHEIGLMLLNYELTLNGFKTIYIGESVPLPGVKDVKNYFDNITYVTYITVEPSPSDINRYIESMKREVLTDNHTNLYVFGRCAAHIRPELLSNAIQAFASVKEFGDSL